MRYHKPDTSCSVADLPQPPAGKTGWPWTEGSEVLPETMPDGRSWPKISIVTPSRNQGEYIEETIRSVLLQGYPNLEYIVIDGGSTDGSVDIIKKYEPWIAYWESEPDRGQAHAINKGFERAAGDLLSWLNSDDVLLPGALAAVANFWVQQPDDIVLGDMEVFHDGQGDYRRVHFSSVTLAKLMQPWSSMPVWNQPGTFVPRALHCAVDELDEGLHYAFDWDWICRLVQQAGVRHLDRSVVRFRLHDESKTSVDVPGMAHETLTVLSRHWHAVKQPSLSSIRSAYHLHMAAVHLGQHREHVRYWSRLKGIRHLLEAIALKPRLVLDRNCRLLCRRSLTPRQWLRSSPFDQVEN